jgi:hypothetical protein
MKAATPIAAIATILVSETSNIRRPGFWTDRTGLDLRRNRILIQSQPATLRSSRRLPSRRFPHAAPAEFDGRACVAIGGGTSSLHGSDIPDRLDLQNGRAGLGAGFA